MREDVKLTMRKLESGYGLVEAKREVAISLLRRVADIFVGNSLRTAACLAGDGYGSAIHLFHGSQGEEMVEASVFPQAPNVRLFTVGICACWRRYAGEASVCMASTINSLNVPAGRLEGSDRFPHMRSAPSESIVSGRFRVCGYL